MDEKTIAVIREVAHTLRNSAKVGTYHLTEMAEKLEALLPSEETLEEVAEELLKTSRFFEPEMCDRLRAALERRKAGK